MGALTSVTDRIEVEHYYLHPGLVAPPVPGAGKLAGTAGPLPTKPFTYTYDDTGYRSLSEKIVDESVTAAAFDAAGRTIGISGNCQEASTFADGASDPANLQNLSQ